MEKKPIRFIVYRYSHHTPHSGYSRTAEYGLAQNQGEIIPVSRPVSRLLVRERMMWRIAKGTPGYDRAAMAAELKVAWHMIKDRGYIYHFLYGETTYHYAGLFNNHRDNRLIATFHLPPSGIQQAVQIDWHLRQLSAVICVGRSQQEYFTRLLDADRVFFVPLGIDTQYFTPPASFGSRDPDLCLFVGENYRDLPTFRGLVELVAYRRPETRFVAVIPRRSFELIGQHPNLTLLSNVPEPELLDLYRSASMMVMPLHDATANNAVLEALACGLPIVVSDVGSIRDYVCPECVVLTQPHDAKGMADFVIDLLKSPLDRQRISEKARQHALQLSWPEAIRQLNSVYSALS